MNSNGATQSKENNYCYKYTLHTHVYMLENNLCIHAHEYKRKYNRKLRTERLWKTKQMTKTEQFIVISGHS